MAEFKIAQAKVKQYEGGYTANPKDLGNWLAVNGNKTAWAKFDKAGKAISPIGGSVVLVGTNFGVAAPTLAAWKGGPVTAAEMKALPYETALKIFKNAFWDLPLKGDTITDQSIAEIIYDANIQHSPGTVGRMLTETTGKKITLPIDASEIGIINSADPADLFEKIKRWRKDYYKSLNKPEFEKGWLSRIESYAYSGIKKVAQEVIKETGKAVDAAKANPGKTAAGIGALFFFGWGVKRVFFNKPK
jgi:lysozyme family protein